MTGLKKIIAVLLLAALMVGCGAGKEPVLGVDGAAPLVVVTPVIPPTLSTPGILDSYAIASYGGITNINSTVVTKINGDTVMDPNPFCNGSAVGNTDDFGLCNVSGQPLTNNVGLDKVTTQTWPDTTTADAVMVALLAKWNSISPAGAPGATVLGCGTIGDGGEAGVLLGCASNAVLPPGIYLSSTSSTIGVAGTLTLNGGPTDVWIIQVPSALTTATGSTILLTGGAKASNVWWFVGSSATLGTGTTFNGNVLASASISMLALSTSCGRLLSGAEGSGAFVFESNMVSVPGHPNAPVGCI